MLASEPAKFPGTRGCLRSFLSQPQSSLIHRIIAMLSPDEQALFKERIRFLDKKIHPGLKKLNWALKGASAFFITECRIHASKVGRGHRHRRSIRLAEG